MKNLFVGNLSFQMTEGDLTALFRGYGEVTRVHIAVDRETGRARGFAFVEMPNDEEAAKAIAGLDGKEFGGRSLKVNEARPRTERAAPRSNNGEGRGLGRVPNKVSEVRPRAVRTTPRSSGSGGRRPGRFSNDDYREAARQPREPRW